MEKKYKISEIFYSIQGEGLRAGTVNVFVRFSGCNLKCSADDKFAGFDCDTEFESGSEYTAKELVLLVMDIDEHNCRNVIFTGGEPFRQLDDPLIEWFHNAGFHIAVETNGTYPLPDQKIDWICVSPKSAEHTVRIRSCHELKYVRHVGQSIPETTIQADHYLISPAFEDHKLSKANLDHCIRLVKDNPKWRLSLQLHNFLGVR